MPGLEQIEWLFHQALTIDGDPERRQWLTDRCGTDQRLLAEVLSLLEANQEMSSGEFRAFRRTETVDEQA